MLAYVGLDQYTPAGYRPARQRHCGLVRMAPAPKLEERRDAWLAAPDAAAQQVIGAAMQAQAFADVPFLPLGEYLPTAYSTGLKGVLKGMPLFWNVERAA